MAKITMTMKPKGGPIILKGITREMHPRLKKALREVGGTVTKQIKRHLTEEKRATPPGRKYPSYQSGRLFGSITHRPRPGPGVVIGPGRHIKYAARQEFGYDGRQKVTPKMRGFLHTKGIHLRRDTTSIRQHTPARPYVFPAWDKLKGKMLKIVSRTVVGRG